MELSDFPYTTTNRLVKYAKLVTKAIASFNRNNAFTLGTIAHDPSYGLSTNEDLLEYWDNSSNIISYGRYLLFENLKEEKTKFWAGLRSSQKEKSEEEGLLIEKLVYCIWFKIDNTLKDYLSTEDIEKLEAKFSPNFHKSSGEIWIPMEEKEFEKFCSSDSYAHCRRQILKNFLRTILGVLK
jgi:hypothetical protein